MKHTLSVLVENKPGALMRVTSMFARRGFNIESLAVGPTERHEVSRITLRVDCEHHTLEQIEKQMHKLVNVLRVQELSPGESVERELAGGHEALLVRKPEVDAVLERPERGMDAGEADDGIQDDVRLGPFEQVGQVAADLLERCVDVVER